jgi:hypothetical protein
VLLKLPGRLSSYHFVCGQVWCAVCRQGHSQHVWNWCHRLWAWLDLEVMWRSIGHCIWMILNLLAFRVWCLNRNAAAGHARRPRALARRVF